jgi:hypothetical protein
MIPIVPFVSTKSAGTTTNLITTTRIAVTTTIITTFDDSWMDEIGVHPKDGFGTYKDDDMVLEKERVEKEEKEMSGVSGGETKIGQQQQRQVGMGKK